MVNLLINNKSLSCDRNAFVMGIVNCTPDSFYDKSRGDINLAMKLINDGADMLDIGAVSTRPGFSEISEEEEIKRLIPLIEQIKKESPDTIISIDTQRLNVFKACYEYGVDILNDVSAFNTDSKLAAFIAEKNLSVILMHGYLQSEEHPSNKNIIKNVNSFLQNRINFAIKNGINKNNILVDPGIGFGKTFEENITLIKNADKICKKKFPIVMALSRKRCIGTMTDNENVQDRLVGTICANLFSVLKGACVLRVHDVKETVDSLKVMKYML